MSALPVLVIVNPLPGKVLELEAPDGMAWFERMYALVAELDARLRVAEPDIMWKADIWDIR